MARVHNGDTFAIGSTTLTLAGMDAPELIQHCADSLGKPYACGRIAAERLIRLVDGETVKCRRMPAALGSARCFIGKTDLTLIMLDEGHAITTAVGRNSNYLLAEDKARRAKRGIWQGKFLSPDRWRSAMKKARFFE